MLLASRQSVKRTSLIDPGVRPTEHLAADASITVELKDGRKVSGTPRNGPQSKDDGINELYLTHPCALANGQWHPVGAGLIVPLAEVASIVLSEEPTGAE
jgi:hypothetical protein